MDLKVIHIQNPDEPALINTYRTLPRLGEINLSTLIENLEGTLATMESIGFIGMEVVYYNTSSDTLNIRAYKGKSGPCYNTGRSAVYKGLAIAALDDDHHLLFRDHKTPVCEKTAKIYMLPAFEKLIECSDANPVLLEKLDDVPEIFDCDTFEEDQERLFQSLKNSEKAKDLTGLFYPGPFRLLILKDGRIIKRGQVTMIPNSDASDLIKRDGLFKIENFKTLQPVFFQEIYSFYGTRCLLDHFADNDPPEGEGGTDFTRLDNTSRELKERLLSLIKNNKNYFILTGSDSRDKLGCCPSEVVTEANRLKSAGILDAFRQPGSGETCPVTIYAFKNEIKIQDNDLQFNIDDDFRQLILEKLQTKTNYRFMGLAKWILLAFVVITLTIAFLRLFDPLSSSQNLSLYEQLDPGSKNQMMVLLFHYSERCNLCLNMEKYTNEVLNEDFPELVAGKKLQFKLFIIDKQENRNLVDRFGLFTTTIVLVKFENKKEKKTRVLKDSWKYAQDGPLFKEMLKKELYQFLNDRHE